MPRLFHHSIILVTYAIYRVDIYSRNMLYLRHNLFPPFEYTLSKYSIPENYSTLAVAGCLKPLLAVKSTSRIGTWDVHVVLETGRPLKWKAKFTFATSRYWESAKTDRVELEE